MWFSSATTTTTQSTSSASEGVDGTSSSAASILPTPPITLPSITLPSIILPPPVPQLLPLFDTNDSDDLEVDLPLEGDDNGQWSYINKQTMTYFIAGGLAGAASRTVVSPLERLKIILQVQPPQSKALKVTGGSGGSGGAYHGVWSSLVRMYKEEGMRGYMKGNGVNCARIIPYSAVQFASYESLKTNLLLWSGDDVLSTPLRLASGALAGICSVVSTYPLDLVRSRLSIATASIATGKGKGKLMCDVVDKDLGIWGMTRKVYRTEGGVRGLYRGIVATAAGVAPYVSLNFFIYETLKARFIVVDEEKRSDIGMRTLLCGAAAGTLSQTVTYPFDVLRRKMQVAGMSELSPKYKGAVDATIQIIRAEGWWGGMYKGLWPNLLKVAPSIATSFFVYESVKDFIERYED